jgi:SpoVK/Ycf46/Vps4 family AAA+-type ATPase
VTEGTLGLFGRVDEFPNAAAGRRLAALVGLDELVDQLVTDAVALLDPSALDEWSTRVHGAVIPAVRTVTERTPLFVFAGDVGVGKTELAEVLGQAIAVSARVDVTLYPLSLTARGRGAVGEMTTLLTKAFERVRSDLSGARGTSGRANSMAVLLVDEADALAQSRELAQMHHEDRAGVNALIRGIDDLRAENLPVLTILCTNRVDALDPAVRRRAAAIHEFLRPNDDQRRNLLGRLLTGTSVSQSDIVKLANCRVRARNVRLVSRSRTCASGSFPGSFCRLVDGTLLSTVR